MTGKYFLDTNFLVYCFSEDELQKRETCLALLQQGKQKAAFVLSTQVLNEFAAVMLKKYKLPANQVKGIIDNLTLFEVVPVDATLIKEAIGIYSSHQLSFWDSLIISAAKTAHCHTLLTEDLHHGAKLEGLHIENPFIK